MGVFDGIKKQVSKTADAVKKQTAEAAENVKKQAQKLPDSVKDINLSESVNDLKKAGGSVFEKMKNQGSSLVEKAKNARASKEANVLLRAEDVLRVLYYLMAADGEISPEEMEKFYEIGKDVDPAFEEHKESLVKECEDYLDKAVDADDRYDILHEHAAEAIRASQGSADGTVQPKVFLWNLLTVAFAEGDYSENEVRLIRALARVMDIDLTIAKEMETAIRTLMAIAEEEIWLKNSSRSYGEVEPHLNELADRKNAVMQGVMALMLD